MNFLQENKCNRNFLEKIIATGIFSRQILLQEFSRENSCANYFLEKIHVAKWEEREYLLRDFE